MVGIDNSSPESGQLDKITNKPTYFPLQNRSPVTRTPPEILAYIFELYLTSLEELASRAVPLQGLLCVTQICKCWRAVAESDPHLWRSIHFYFPESRTSRDTDVSKVKPLFDLHLKRSAALPISLTFVDHRTYDPATKNLISLLVRRLRTHARRWKHISLHLPCGYFPQLYEFTPCDLSSLKYFYINGKVGTGPLPRNRIRLKLNSAVNLKSFTFSTPHCWRDEINLHWENLSEVSFAFAPHVGNRQELYDQVRYLAQCQSITTCSLGIGATSPLSGSQTFTLPCLQTLRIRRLSDDTYASTLIDSLILPQLHTLEIDAPPYILWHGHWHGRYFSRLLERSGCTLLHLSIRDVYFRDDELVRCLSLTPALTSLCFIPCPRSQKIDDVIQTLNVTHNSVGGQFQSRRSGMGQRANTSPLIPQLREVMLGTSVKEYLDPMKAMLCSRVGAHARTAGVTPLRRAEVVFFELWHDQNLGQVHVPGARSESIATFRSNLVELMSENRNESGKESEDKGQFEALMVVDSPYLPGYIEV